jgi:eukaryotic-like serine/threonine-protein kinase
VITRQPLLDVAAALADGTPVDWESADHSLLSDEDRQLLAELRFIAAMVRPASGQSAVASGAATGRETARLAALPAPRTTGETWGPLEIIERVGGGSFGDVYRAWDSRLDREVALKIVRRREHDEARTSSVIREGRLLARVRHPNVVTVYGAERIDGQAGVWMEFIHGRTLEQQLVDQGPFDVDRAIRIGLDLAEALTTVHRAGLIHGDVKTHNVMCGSDGRIVLTDFGAGFVLDETTIAGSRELAGTPVCLAPEVFAGRPATASSDVYSLGVLLYHLVTGTYPVRGRSLKEVRDAHVEGGRTPLSTARPGLPDPFVRIVDRALEPDPANRYDSPAALRAALESLVAPADTGRSMSPSATRRRWVAAAASVLVVAAIVGSVPRWWRSHVATIAVVPFKNLSPDLNGDYFVDGLTDEIIRNLSVIDGLAVRSRTSSFTFKDRPRNIRDVGRQLGADLVVEGSVLRSDGRLRINAQLVRAADDTPLWSEKFDRDAKDIFAVQDEISRSIVNHLRLKLGRGQRRYNTNLEAYEVYLKARSLGDPVDVAKARAAAELFERVIAKDAAFAPAYAGLADAWAAMSINRVGVPPDEAFAVMEPAAQRALQLDPLLAEAHAAMGVVAARDRKWNEAEAAFRRAVALNPSLSSVRMNFVMSTLWPEGRVDEALAEVQAASRADPLSPDVQRLMAYLLISAGRYDESIEVGRRALQAEPDHPHARQQFARALFLKGERAEAIRRFEQLGPGSHNFRGYAYAATGRRADAEAIAVERRDFPAALVLIHAGLGDKDRAFEALDRMEAERDPRVGIYLTYPELTVLRDDPRMDAFKRRLGLRR